MAPGMLDKQSHPRHPRVAIGIGEINLAADKDLPTIRAPRRQDEHRQDDDFKDRKSVRGAPRVLIEIRNACSAKVPMAAGPKMARLGPPGFEPGTKGL